MRVGIPLLHITQRAFAFAASQSVKKKYDPQKVTAVFVETLGEINPPTPQPEPTPPPRRRAPIIRIKTPHQNAVVKESETQIDRTHTNIARSRMRDNGEPLNLRPLDTFYV